MLHPCTYLAAAVGEREQSKSKWDLRNYNQSPDNKDRVAFVSLGHPTLFPAKSFLPGSSLICLALGRRLGGGGELLLFEHLARKLRYHFTLFFSIWSISNSLGETA